MNLLSLGKTQLQIPPLCIGTWAWGNNWISNEKAPLTDLREVFENATNHKLNFYDTAEAYGFGKSEKILGNLIKSNPTDTIISTKFNPNMPRLSLHPLKDALRNSLKRLNADKIDLYYIHVMDKESNLSKWVNGIADLYEEGLIRGIGTSNYDLQHFLKAYELLDKRGIHLSAVQMHYSLLNRSHEHSGLLEECKKLGVTFFAYMPLAQGLLTGKYTPSNPPKGIVRKKLYSPEIIEKIQPLIGELTQIGEKYNKLPAQVAMNWIISKGTVPIVGIRNVRQLLGNLESINWTLSPEDLLKLDELTEKYYKETIKVYWE